MIIIVNYGLGNVKSLHTALLKQGINAKVTADREEIDQAQVIFLPGVGAYRDAQEALWKTGLAAQLIRRSKEGAYIIGICLGMQLLYDKSFENGEYQGLGLIPGDIVKLEKMPKVPHMGWNNLIIEKDDPLVEHIKSGDFVYFVHSFYAKSSGEEIIAYAEYGEKIPAVVRHNNVIGFQFHPEKSSVVGEQLLQSLSEFIFRKTTNDEPIIL
jgi:glutamine amidotransferase